MGKKKEAKTSTEIVPSLFLPQLNTNSTSIQTVVKKTNAQIQSGLEKTTASPGTPIKDLHGAAKFMAQLANIGNGSVSSGGGGIKAGFNTVATNIAAKAMMTTGIEQKR